MVIDIDHQLIIIHLISHWTDETTHHLLWVTPTNSSQSDTLQVKSPILVKQTDWCYILGSPKPLIGNQVRHILIIFSIFLFSFTYISCSSSSDDGSKSTDTTPPTVSSSSPSDGDTSVSITSNVSVTFSETMDTSSQNGYL